MSNIFITDIFGQNAFAVPASDSEMATATAALDAILSGLGPQLSYERIVSWVDTANGVAPVRTLNCLLERMKYNGEECPDTAEVQTVTGAIETALENDGDIFSIGLQQVHLFQGPDFSWQRDSSGFVYPTTAADDIAVGSYLAPSGKWFQDGDMVLGGSVMSAKGEVLRVIGDERIEGGSLMDGFNAVPISPSAGQGTYWVEDLSPTADSLPKFTDDTPTTYTLEYLNHIKSLVAADHLLFVDKTSGAYVANGTIQSPYNTIGSAITAATALKPDLTSTWQTITGTAPNMFLNSAAGLFLSNMVGRYVTITDAAAPANNGTFLITSYVSATQIGYRNANGVATVDAGSWVIPHRISIMIYPGIYDESITTANENVDFIGFDKNSTIIRRSSGSTIPLTVTKGNIRFENLTFECDGTNTGRVVSMQTSLPLDKPVIYRGCNFLGNSSSSSNNNVYITRGWTGGFYDCAFKNVNRTYTCYYPTEADPGYVVHDNCTFEGWSYLQGRTEKDFFNCSFISSSTSYTILGATFSNRRAFFGCRIENTSAGGDPVSGSGVTSGWIFKDCEFRCGATAYDITASNILTAVVEGCSMTRGMYYLVRRVSPIIYANGSPGDFDFYATLDDAVRSIGGVTPTRIVLLNDVTLTAQLGSLAAADIVTIDGQGLYTLSRAAARIIQVGGGTILTFKDIRVVGEIYATGGTGQQLRFENVDLEGRVLWNGDSTMTFSAHDSKLVGSSSTYGSPIEIVGTTTGGKVIVSNTYLKGYTAKGAVKLQATGTGNTVNFDGLRFEYSQAFHGSLGGNNPIEGAGVGGAPPVNDYAAHHTVFNAEPDVVDSTYLLNTIDSAQRHNTIDPDGDFSWLP
jgi:hypothetical protein